MIRLRSLAPHLLLAPLLTLVVACGGSDEATDTTPAPVATDVATGGAAIDTLPPLETTAAGVDPTLPPAPVATVPVTPEEVCALLTATEVQEFARANGFTADDYTWSAPALSPSGAGCEMSFPTTGVIDLFPSMYASDDELLAVFPDAQVVQPGVVLVTNPTTTAGRIQLASGAAVDIEVATSFALDAAGITALAAALQS